MKRALKEFRDYPDAVKEEMADALEIAAFGEMAGTAKPIKGLGSGVFEIAVAHRGNAYRAVYSVQTGDHIWVVHAFQKKATRGIKTPRKEIDLIRSRLRRLRELQE